MTHPTPSPARSAHWRCRVHRIGWVLAALLFAAFSVAASPEGHDHEGRQHADRHLRVVIPDIARLATLHHDGRRVRVPIEHVWRTMCFSGAATLTYEQLTAIALDATFGDTLGNQPAAQPQPQPQPPLVPLGDGGDEGGIAGGGLDIEFLLDASVPAEAADALLRVEQVFEQAFTDDITVRISLEFDNLPGGVLGATGAPYTNVTWNTSRNGLQNDMDDSDVIQSHLPAGPRIPVRYNGASAFITQESRVFWTVANFNAAVGFIGGNAGNMRFNQNIAWDYDPDDGVSGFSFIDVLTHEVGHVLGFASGVDFRDQDIESLDIYRFQRTDGGFDWNPDNYAEFQTTARTADYNVPDNDCISDIVIAQYKMEDGNPFQASHFKDKIPAIGIMDPVLGGGETFRPQFLRSADKRMFDAIGWDR